MVATSANRQPAAIAYLRARGRAYHEREWRDSLVVVEKGSIELETMSGARLRLGSGAISYLMGLPLRELHNRGSVPAILAVISRRARPNSFPGFGV